MHCASKPSLKRPRRPIRACPSCDRFLLSRRECNRSPVRWA
ncbi:unnamed protein product [Ciceribacter sp. T2.26MG-112.2]|nr:unnamed protein product [Ciceribacter naphthalenivorans]